MEKNEGKIVFVTQNMAPFRMEWLDELAKYYTVVVYQLDDYHKSVNQKYIYYRPKNMVVKSEYRTLFGKKFFKTRWILREKANVLILDGYGFLGQMFLITALKRKSVPFIMSVDGGFIPERENKLKKAIKRFCLNAPHAFFSTSSVTDRFISHYCKKNAQYYRHYFSSVHNWDIVKIESDEKEALKEKLDLKDKFGIITVGRFLPIKGFDILLRAMEYADQNVCIVFVGGQPTDEYLRIIKSLNINKDNIKFIDFLTKEELKLYYLASDVFVTASRGDVWGLVVGEAMSYGLPVVSSDKCIAGVSMIRNYENGFVVSGENPENYWKAIKTIKDDEQLAKHMRNKNYEIISSYTVENTIFNDIDNINHYLEDMKKH